MADYRIKRRWFGYEPQMRHTMGALDGTRWFPLNEAGFWLEPDAFNYGKITRHLVFRAKSEAQAIIRRAEAVNFGELRLLETGKEGR